MSSHLVCAPVVVLMVGCFIGHAFCRHTTKGRRREEQVRRESIGDKKRYMHVLIIYELCVEYAGEAQSVWLLKFLLNCIDSSVMVYFHSVVNLLYKREHWTTARSTIKGA